MLVEGRGSSSAMPHKSNPVLATMIRSAALQVPALSAGLAGCMLAEDERSAGAWHAEWQLLRECLRLAGGAAHTAVELAEGLVVGPERMRANLGMTRSQVVSERVAAVLAPRLGRGPARDVLSQASTTARRTGSTTGPGACRAPRGRPAPRRRGAGGPAGPGFYYTGAAGPLVDRALRRPGGRLP